MPTVRLSTVLSYMRVGGGSLYVEVLQLNTNRLLGDSPVIVQSIKGPFLLSVSGVSTRTLRNSIATNFEVNRLGY